ncbi:MAG: cob(I)yrinic acid a,c-diamide adenosyltransferase [Patescibacteria group bacterium]
MKTFYTKAGDKGKNIVGKNKINKDNPIMEILGELDELNSLCGLARALIKNSKIKKFLKKVQEDIFIIQAIVAQKLFVNDKTRVFKFGEKKIEELEKIINDIGKGIKNINSFIVPGSNIESARLDYLRAIARKIERRIIKNSKKINLNKNIFAYLNRLSSLFFVLARYSANSKGIKEENPQYK